MSHSKLWPSPQLEEYARLQRCHHLLCLPYWSSRRLQCIQQACRQYARLRYHSIDCHWKHLRCFHRTCNCNRDRHPLCDHYWRMRRHCSCRSGLSHVGSSCCTITASRPGCCTCTTYGPGCRSHAPDNPCCRAYSGYSTCSSCGLRHAHDHGNITKASSSSILASSRTTRSKDFELSSESQG